MVRMGQFHMEALVLEVLVSFKQRIQVKEPDLEEQYPVIQFLREELLFKGNSQWEKKLIT